MPLKPTIHTRFTGGRLPFVLRHNPRMDEVVRTSCCIAGGGPAGMMLALLLARADVEVVVLEKHADFLRDFRGDTIHPSTLEVMYELGLLQTLLKLPHQEMRELAGRVGADTVTIADFTHLPTHCQFLVLMPQWDFLDFLKKEAGRYPAFHLRMETEVTDLLEESGQVQGVRAKTANGSLEVRAGLTVGADGRHSIVRKRANLEVIDLGAPMDVLWMRLSRRPTDPGQTLGHVDKGKIFVMLNRESYWQCGFVIAKGEANAVREKGLDSFRAEIAAFEPFLRDRVLELRDWNDVRVLTVAVDRLSQWSRPGLLCIGDAAHAMSPIGGVGINLAIQDAVAAANILGPILLKKAPSQSELQPVQRRREFPTRAAQQLQLVIQSKVIGKVLGNPKPLTLPWPMVLLRRWPILRRIPARVLGVGFRSEHVKIPNARSLA